MAQDPFKLDTGLLDNEDITVLKAWYEHDPEYQSGDPLVLKWECEVEGDDYDEPVEIMFSCGDAYTTNDGGATAERVDGNTAKNFNMNSSVGIMVTSLLEHGAEDDMRAKYASDGWTLKDAAIYEGMMMHVERMDHDYKGDIGIIPRLVCSEGGWKGYKDGSKPSAAKAAAKGGAAAKAGAAAKPAAKGAAAKAAPPAEAETLDDETTKVLSDLADGCSTHDEFMERAMAEYTLSPVAEEAVRNVDEGSLWDLSCKRAAS